MVHAMFTNPYSQLAIPEVSTAALQGTFIGNACSQSVSKTSSQGEKTHDCDPPSLSFYLFSSPSLPHPFCPLLSSFSVHSLLLRFPESLSHQILFWNLFFKRSFYIWVSEECVITGKRNIHTFWAWHGPVLCGLGRYVWEYHMAITQPGHRGALYGIPLCPIRRNRHSVKLAHTDSFNRVHKMFFSQLKIMYFFQMKEFNHSFLLSSNPESSFASSSSNGR